MLHLKFVREKPVVFRGCRRQGQSATRVLIEPTVPWSHVKELSSIANNNSNNNDITKYYYIDHDNDQVTIASDDDWKAATAYAQAYCNSNIVIHIHVAPFVAPANAKPPLLVKIGVPILVGLLLVCHFPFLVIIGAVGYGAFMFHRNHCSNNNRCNRDWKDGILVELDLNKNPQSSTAAAAVKAPTPTPTSTPHPMAAQLETLKRLGFNDVVNNLMALSASNGDVAGAVATLIDTKAQ
jgi:hypothetical protein